ncbi:hypothetical protein HCN44_000717 [Aphidius gifuensis]|uniref:Uncharacterized protein n=1 Tax=Aphidius gifuensis TaxID=684658 RepID=A0A834XQY0_APHGI|nr:hypothetical protein HCN44_000717 [Aphidius gifuensis]
MKKSKYESLWESPKHDKTFSDAIEVSLYRLQKKKLLIDSTEDEISDQSIRLGVKIFKAIMNVRKSFLMKEKLKELNVKLKENKEEEEISEDDIQNESMCIDHQQVSETLDKHQKSFVYEISESESDVPEMNNDQTINNSTYSLGYDEEVEEYSTMDENQMLLSNDNNKLKCTSSAVILSEQNIQQVDTGGVKRKLMDNDSNLLTTQNKRLCVVETSINQQSGPSSTSAPKNYALKEKTLDNNNGSRQYQLRSDSRENLETTTRSQSMSVPPQHLVEPENEWNSETYQENEVYNDDISTEELYKKIRGILNKLTPHNIDKMIAMYQLQDKLDNSTYPYFIRKSFEIILVGPSSAREKYCILFAQMIINNIFPLSVFQSEYDKMFEEIESLDIYLAPTFWTSRAELLKPLVICDAHPMKELIRTTSVLKNMGFVGKLVGELLRLLVESEGPSTITEKWNASGIEWTDLLDTSLEDPDDIIEKYNLQFLTFGVTDPPNEKLLDLLRESDIANAIQWITENVDEEKSRKPKFIRTLFTGILESAIEPVEDSRYFCGAMAPYHFDRIKIMHLLSIMRHYIDSNLKSELQCLYAMSDVMHKYGNLSSFGGFLIHQLHEEKIISDNGFLAWHSCTNKSESIGHVEAVNCLINQPFWIELQRSFNNSEDEAWNDFINNLGTAKFGVIAVQ